MTGSGLLRRALAVAGLAVPLAASTLAHAAPSYTLFESGQVRPLALSADGKHLFAVNTPDGRLEIFRVKKSGLSLVSSVPVGLEPVAVAARSDDEVWVVNHLSDSVSVVDVSDPTHGRVVRTLLVGDEPRVPRSSATSWCPTEASRPAAWPRPTRTSKAYRSPRAASSSSTTAPTGSITSAAPGTTRCASRCPTRTSSSSTPWPIRR